MNNLEKRANKVLMNTYASIPVNFVSGQGCYVVDNNGKKYLDFLSGIAVNALGYNHPRFNRAVHDQLDRIIHYSNLFLNEQQILLAEKLISKSNFTKAFFCNSGTEAVEAALKLAKKFGKVKKNGAWKIIAMNNSFHGRTTGSLSLTGQMKYQKSFLPLLQGIIFADFNNFNDLKLKVDKDVCGIILEPVQGEGGIHPANKEYLEKVRALCTEENIPLIFDEVQCGIGRTGKLFAHEHFGVYPDIIALAKGLGGGLPIGSILSTDSVNSFEPGDHAATFGGNPLVCSGALAVLEELIDKGVLDKVQETGEYLTKRLKSLKKEFNYIRDIRGLGLMIGLELDKPVSQIVSKCRDRGLLLGTAGANVIRMVPPLILSKEEVDKAMSIFHEVLQSVA